MQEIDLSITEGKLFSLDQAIILRAKDSGKLSPLVGASGFLQLPNHTFGMHCASAWK